MEILDQVVLESYKSAGTCLASSEPFEGEYGSMLVFLVSRKLSLIISITLFQIKENSDILEI